MSDEVQLLREFGADVPDMEPDAVRRIHERATSGGRTLVPGWRHTPFSRPTTAFIALTVAALVAISIPIVLGSRGANHDSSLRSNAHPRSAVGARERIPTHPPVSAGGLVPTSVSVSNVDQANARLPFTAVLPSNATPTDIQVPISTQPSASSGWLTAQFDTTGGSFQLNESSSSDTVTTLQQWASTSAQKCSNCTQQVVTQDGVHVLILASPIIGLRLAWVRGDGSSPVLTELDWSPDMPANNLIPSQQAALAIASDIIRQGG